MPSVGGPPDAPLARAPPQASLNFDQTPDFDLTEPGPLLEIESWGGEKGMCGWEPYLKSFRRLSPRPQLSVSRNVARGLRP